MMISSTLPRALACAGMLMAFALPAHAVADVTLTHELDTRSDATCSGETAFGNFVADAARKIHGADIALISCTVIRGNRTYVKGATFDPAAASAEIAPDAKLVQVEMSGEQLLNALEQALSAAPSASPGFLQVAGIRMEANAAKPAGQRIVKLTSNGSALDFARAYKVATTEETAKALLAAGAKMVEGQPAALAQDVASHLQAEGVRDIKVLGRIKLAR